MVEIDPNRLERIEKKIDELGEAFVIMARVEEKIVNLEHARVESNKRYDVSIEAVLREIKLLHENYNRQNVLIADNTRITGLINKGFWVLLTAIAGAYALQIL